MHGRRTTISVLRAIPGRVAGRVALGYVLALAFTASSCMTMRSPRPAAEPPPMEVDPALLLRTAPGHGSSAELPPVDTSACRRLGVFAPSFYQIVDERNFEDSGARFRVRDRNGRTISRVRAGFHRRLNIEGCGRLADGRVATYDTRVDGEIRFRVTDAPFGLSHGERPLVPYRTAAVDPETLPLGSVIFVPAVRGALLPDGRVHDGLFLADDVGSAITGRRIDFFVGFEDHIDNSLTADGRMRHHSPVTVYEVPDELAIHLVADAAP